MSLLKLEDLYSDRPEWEPPLRAMASHIRALSSRARLFPAVVAAETGLPGRDVIAIMQLLSEAGLGALRFRVLDHGGHEVDNYASTFDLPDTVVDEMGDEVEVTPENVQLVFVPAQGLPHS